MLILFVDHPLTAGFAFRRRELTLPCFGGFLEMLMLLII